MRSILQCIVRTGCDVVSCVSPQNNVCDDEYVEQYQEYDIRNHVCYPIACVKEWAQYRNMWQMSIVQSKIMQMNVVLTRAHAFLIGSNRIISARLFLRARHRHQNLGYAGVLPDHLCTGGHAVHLYVGYVADWTPTDPF